ncbi:alpha-L-rhamnosidase [Aestuariimicrobium sp. T2.26MG-19.2B]|uniref:alpha-L-rhamnosidase n=1 Tax=Aestuariimicrobium sp. T2.26MG-19.2B TaxID=3040679 RepID=UPI002477A16B|nr:alpha-L-rhamnosidase [Aestuariimicrobium sp. T2.26MG-19.2B]CAI9408344.1 Alpha-L-rhamnosidase [Aestuariimicrobium sp. T2.26MG-19.2B]
MPQSTPALAEPSPKWTARLIAASTGGDSAPRFRREFTVDHTHGAIVRARWFVSAHGIFEAQLDGRPIGPDVLSPGWTSYEWRQRYREYDVTHRLHPSVDPVVASILVGNGWWAGRLTWQEGRRHLYGDRTAVIAQLEITFADGYVQTVVTDASWDVGPSEVLTDDLYDGQTIDARRAARDWLRPGFSSESEPRGWGPAEVLDFDASVLVPYLGPPVVRHEELPPRRIWTSPSGRTLVDFGQNVVGWVKLRVQGPAGQEVIMRHAEVLEHEELGTRPLRSALATDRFVLSGGADHFEPTFTFHGFRYVEVEGWPGELDRDDLRAVVVSSDLRRTGHFESSHAGLNQLHRNVVWGLRGNMVDVPTDCPQRDERLGWTGDLAVFAPTATFLYDMRGFLGDWLADLRAEQVHAGGRVAFVIPDALKIVEPGNDATAAVWSDAAVWVPWALWQAHGDVDALTEAYPAMLDHVDHVTTLLSPTGLWDTGFQFGDWLDPAAPPDHADQARADKGVVATAALYRSATLTATAARVLGREQDAARLEALATRTKRAFNEHWVGDDGTVFSDCPTVYALAIAFDLLDEPRRQLAGDRLAQLTREEGFHIATGFAGTPFVCDALTSTGHLVEAYRLLLQTECPSWLYPVTMGATTIWERWDSMLPDGSINPGEMTSFNHYALGAVADWLHRTVAGLAPAEPGYARVRFAPRPGLGVEWARAWLDTPHGRASIRWSVADGELHVLVDTPVEADLDLPGVRPERVAAGRHSRVVPVGSVLTGIAPS